MKRTPKYLTACIDVVAVKREVKRFEVREDSPESQFGSLVISRNEAAKAARVLLGDLACEGVVVIMLNSASRIIGAARVALGVDNQCAVHPKTIFSAALLSGASSIILAHNHPGGNMSTSESDWAITQKIKQCGQALDIPLLDHIIITDDAVVSMRDHARWQS